MLVCRWCGAMRYDYVTEAGKTITQDTMAVNTEQPAVANSGDAALPAVVKQERRPRAPSQPRAPAYPPAIAKAIIAISDEIGVVQKCGYNDFQRYKYTLWEDISERLSPLLTKYKLVIVQTEINRTLLEQNDKGSVLSIIYNFTIVNEDGQMWPPIEWTGIARLRDQKGITDDKAPLKCQTQAEKSFCVKLFKIRSGDFTPEDERRPQRVADERATYQTFLNEITAITTLIDLDNWKKQNLDRVRAALRDTWLGYFNVAFNEKREDLCKREREYEEYIETQEGEDDGKC
jgi:hypothetical protein